MSDPFTFVAEITPDQAQSLLDNNIDKNRKVRETHVQELAEAMRRGEWRLTHQGLGVDVNGKLIDGQHRCLAIVQAGVTVRMLVTMGIETTAFNAVDNLLRPRSHADVLQWTRHKTGALRALHDLATAPTRVPISPDRLLAIAEWAAPIYDQVYAATKNVRLRSSSGPFLACMVRAMTPDADYAIRVYGAFTALDAANMPPIASALLRQLDREDVSATTGRWDLAARVWVMLDPTKAKLDRLLIKNVNNQIDEMRAAVTAYHGGPWT